jgi:uncharacterized protein
MKKKFWGIVLAFVVFFACGCVETGCSREGVRARATINETFPLAVGAARISVQVAVTTPEMEKGLMYRTDLADNIGMIFVYKTPEKMRYWMKNVPIPLSIGFFKADGTLSEVRALLPNDARTTASSGADIQFVLEMNEGWYERHGVKPGDRLDRKLLAGALELRGEDSAEYGL